MIKPKVGFVVYGVHKDGLQDPMGQPFIDDAIVAKAKKALLAAGLDLVVEDLVIATKQEAQACFAKFKKMDDLDALVLFSGTWVWAAHLVPALRDFSFAGKGLLVWTNPGSQGWRPVGGLVMHGGLKEVGIHHRFVYGGYDDPQTIERILAYCRASHEVNRLNMSTVGVFGGRGMGQTCGVADPSQWMKVFGVDIDSRDTTLLLEAAKAITKDELVGARKAIQPLFSVPIPEGEMTDRSLRLYLAIKKVIAQEKWDFYTIQSFPGLGDDYSATCFAQSMMLDERVGTSTLSRFQHLDDGQAPDRPERRTGLLRRPAAHRQIQQRDQDHRRRRLPALAGGQARTGQVCRARHPHRGRGGRHLRRPGVQTGEGVLARLGRTDGEFEMVLTRCTVFEPPAEQLEQRRLECGIPLLAARLRHRPLRHRALAGELEQRVRRAGLRSASVRGPGRLLRADRHPPYCSLG